MRLLLFICGQHAACNCHGKRRLRLHRNATCLDVVIAEGLRKTLFLLLHLCPLRYVVALQNVKHTQCFVCHVEQRKRVCILHRRGIIMTLLGLRFAPIAQTEINKSVGVYNGRYKIEIPQYCRQSILNNRRITVKTAQLVGYFRNYAVPCRSVATVISETVFSGRCDAWNTAVFELTVANVVEIFFKIGGAVSTSVFAFLLFINIAYKPSAAIVIVDEGILSLFIKKDLRK